MALTDGIVGCWSPSLGASGYRLLDRSGRGNHGTLNNMDAGTDWTGTPVGLALDYDGAADNVSFSTITLTGAFSVSVWCLKRTSGSLNEREIIGNTTDANVWIGFTNTTTLMSGTTSGAKTFTGTIANNTINHVVVTRDAGNTARVYINGVESSTGGLTMTGNMPINQFGQYLSGAGGNAPYSWDGWISETAFYNRALTAAEIRELYRRGNGAIGRELTGQTRRRTYGFVAAGFRPYWAARRTQVIGGGLQ
jgi:hypothetical protein